MENIEEKRMDMISKWEEKSRDFIDAFLLLFGREGRLVCTRLPFYFILFFLISFIVTGLAHVYLTRKFSSGISHLLH